MPRPDLTHIVVVLDRSGSMAPIADDTIGGLNKFVEDQRNHPGEAFLTLVQFDHEYTPVHEGVPIRDVPALTRETFVPRGTTALLDAMGRAIVETGERLSAMAEDARPSTVIFVVMTDGQENASREYSKAKINEMISHQRDAYSWQFVFLGANQDAIATAAGMGILRSNSLTYAANMVGTQSAFESTSNLVGNFRSGNRGASYSESDRTRQRDAGAAHSS